jgi:aconitate hydratase
MKIETKRIKTFAGEAEFFPISQLQERGFKVSELPYSIRVLVENVLRNYDGRVITEEDVENAAGWRVGKEIPFMPSRVLMQDYTGVPLLVDLASMRSHLKRIGKDPSLVNPIVPADLVIDHSVQVDYFGTNYSLDLNKRREFERNRERYQFLKWAQKSFKNLRVVPPGHGICHQVNLEYLASVVELREHRGRLTAFPDTLVGTDSHTTMINGLGVLGWGVGGLEAEASMLGEPYYVVIPEVIGVRLVGEPQEGVTPTDIVLYVTETLRKKGVVNKFVEFFGPSLSKLTVQDRATIANMAPEYGATVGFFPIDQETLYYLRGTGREEWRVDLVDRYAKEEGLFFQEEPKYSEVVEVDLSKIEPAIAGPKNPEERIPLTKVKETASTLMSGGADGTFTPNGAVVISAITSCTNTSNPTVMLGAGLLAKKAILRGLTRRPYVKTSMAPGSAVVVEYLKEADLLPYLEGLGFHVVGFGCTTCIGNAGPLIPQVEKDVRERGTRTFAVLSGNRNFEGRIHPLLTGAFLASPPLVVAYALAGRLDIDLTKEPIALDPNGNPVYLRDLWPSMREIRDYLKLAMNPELYRAKYRDVFNGDENWDGLEISEEPTFNWNERSTYIREPPWFTSQPRALDDVINARILALLGDRVTTDHISPAGPILRDSPAGKYLTSLGDKDLNTYGARRGNHEVMIRGGFANPKLKNFLAKREGGFTKSFLDGEEKTIYEAAMEYIAKGIPLVIFAGKQYGTGSSRDWAAKVTSLLGVRAVIAPSFERIHRSNLVAMGVLPIEGPDWREIGIKGDEVVNIRGLKDLEPRKKVEVEVVGEDRKAFTGIVRVETRVEAEYVRSGGILQYVMRKFV